MALISFILMKWSCHVLGDSLLTIMALFRVIMVPLKPGALLLPIPLVLAIMLAIDIGSILQGRLYQLLGSTCLFICIARKFRSCS